MAQIRRKSILVTFEIHPVARRDPLRGGGPPVAPVINKDNLPLYLIKSGRIWQNFEKDRFLVLDTRRDIESSGRDGWDGLGLASQVPKTMTTPPWADPFEAEFGRLPEKLRRFFLSRGVRTEDEALDLVQETLLRVLQRVSRGDRPLDSPEAFSLGVAKNVFLEYCRRVQRANKHEGLSGVLELAGKEDPLSDALASSRKLIVRKALELLPARMKVLLVRRFVEEIPSRTIAREEGISTDAVDMRVYRAKRELKKRMDSTEARSAVRAMREEAARNPSDEEEDR